MSAEATFSSAWRCDIDGETFFATVGVSAFATGGEPVELPVDVDLLIEALPCPICNGPMRRVVSLLDQRDWGAQIS